MASFTHAVSWVAENLQRSYIPNARLPTVRIFNAYREYCAKNNIERPTPDTMIGKLIGKLYPGVTIKRKRSLGGREFVYEGLRFLSPEERERCQELKVPEFCEWKIVDGNFSIRIPKMDVCDGEIVWFEYSVEGETGKLSLYVRNEKVNILEFGFSPYVTLDQVWINSIIHITDKMTLCKGCKNESPFEPESKIVLTHYWNKLSGSSNDTFARLHFHKCKVVQSLWSYREHCADCLCHVNGLLKYLIIRHEEEQERITKGEPEFVTKSKKVQRKKRKHEHQNSECDCTKPKGYRWSKKVTGEPEGGLSEVKVFEPGVFPGIEERTVTDVVLKYEELVKNTGESIQEASNTTVVKSGTEMVPNKTTIIDVVPKTEELVRNTEELTAEEHCDPNGALDDVHAESTTFIPDVKPEIEHDSLVFLPQKSVLKVRTIEESEVENTMTVPDGQVHSNKSKESDSQGESFSILRKMLRQRKSVDTNTYEIRATGCLLCGIPFKSNAEAEAHVLDHSGGKCFSLLDSNRRILPKSSNCEMKHVEAETCEGMRRNVAGSVVAGEKEITSLSAVENQGVTENVLPEDLQEHPIFDRIIQTPGGFKSVPVCLLCRIQFKSDAEADLHAQNHSRATSGSQECGKKSVQAETHRPLHQFVAGKKAVASFNVIGCQEASGNQPIKETSTVTILSKCPICGVTNVEAETHYRKTHNLSVTTGAPGDKSQSPEELVNEARLVLAKASSNGMTADGLQKESTTIASTATVTTKTVMIGVQQLCSSASQQHLQGTKTSASVSQQQTTPCMQQPVLSIVQQQHQATEKVTLGKQQNAGTEKKVTSGKQQNAATENVTSGKQQNAATVLPSTVPHLQVKKEVSIGLKSVFKPGKKQPNILCRLQDTGVNTSTSSQSQFENIDLANAGIKIMPMCLECGLTFDSHYEAEIHKENHRKMLPLQPQSQPVQIIIQATPTLPQTMPTIPSGLPPLQPKPLLTLPSDPQPKETRNSLPLLQPKPSVNQMVPIIIQTVPVLQPVSLIQQTNTVEFENTFELSGNVVQPVPIVQCEPPSKVIKTEEY